MLSVVPKGMQVMLKESEHSLNSFSVAFWVGCRVTVSLALNLRKLPQEFVGLFFLP